MVARIGLTRHPVLWDSRMPRDAVSDYMAELEGACGGRSDVSEALREATLGGLELPRARLAGMVAQCTASQQVVPALIRSGADTVMMQRDGGETAGGNGSLPCMTTLCAAFPTPAPTPGAGPPS